MFKQLTDIQTLLAAWKQVKAKGSSGGIDGLSLADFDDNLNSRLAELRKELNNHAWTPSPYFKIEIPKKKHEKRTLGMLSVKDKIVQHAIKTLIEPRLEKLFLSNSYAYRAGRGTLKAVCRARHEFSLKPNAWVAQMDIDNFFDTIDHEIMFKRLPAVIPDQEIVRLIALSIKMGMVSGNMKWTDVKKGIPQGAVLSPPLANFYLHPFDQYVTSKTESYVRYADDFLVFSGGEEQMRGIEAGIVEFLQTRLNLKLHPPVIVPITEKIEFLGMLVGKDGFTISDSKMDALRSRIRSLQWNNGFTDKSLEMLSGIASYYGRILPQTSLLQMDETLQVTIGELVARFAPHIPNQQMLQNELKKLSFFAAQTELEKTSKIADWIKLYKSKKKPPEDDIHKKNQKLINRRKLEYRKKEAEGSELLISSFGSFIGRNTKGITVKVQGKLVRDMPVRALEHVTVLSNGVSLSSDAIYYCMDNHIPIDFFDHKGKCYASVLHPLFIDYKLWRRQAEMSEEKRMRLASRIIYGKLKNQLHLIKYFHKYHKEGKNGIDAVYRKSVGDIESVIESIGDFHSKDGKYAEQLMAKESAAAVAYWQYIRKLLEDTKVTFESRERQGAKDLFNCMLNYGYAILYSRAWQALLAAKLNPSIGVLHEQQVGKPVFVYDFIEIFRAQAVERVIISLVQKSEPLSMEKDLLNVETRKLLVKNILERLNRYENYRGEETRFGDIIKRQAREISTFISIDAGSFKPYIAKW